MIIKSIARADSEPTSSVAEFMNKSDYIGTIPSALVSNLRPYSRQEIDIVLVIFEDALELGVGYRAS